MGHPKLEGEYLQNTLVSSLTHVQNVSHGVSCLWKLCMWPGGRRCQEPDVTGIGGIRMETLRDLYPTGATEYLLRPKRQAKRKKMHKTGSEGTSVWGWGSTLV